MALTVRTMTQWHEQDVLREGQSVVHELLKQRAIKVQSVAQASLSVSGRSRGPKGGNVHTPSRAPAPPHAQSRALLESIQYEFKDDLTILVGPAALRYGKVHEKGGRYSGRNYPARPFMLPALRKVMG